MRFDASSAHDRQDAAQRGSGPIIDGHAITVAIGSPRSAASGSRLRRYGPAGAAATAALVLAVAGGGFLGGAHGSASAEKLAEATAAHHTPPALVAETETNRQMARLADDVRLLSARMETLRSAVESRQAGDGERALRRSVDALRSGLEQSKLETSKALGSMAQKLDRLPHEPNARLAQIADRLDRMERHAAAPSDITGSIAIPASKPITSKPITSKPVPDKPAATSTPVAITKAAATSAKRTVEADPQGESRGPLKPTATSLPGPRIIMPASLPEAKPQPKFIPGFVLRGMEGDVAIVEGHGQIFALSRGDSMPGVGRVEGLERRGRDWVVVTSRGLISSHSRN